MAGCCCWLCVAFVAGVESGGSVRSSREDLYGGGGSRAGGFRGSNSSLNDGNGPVSFPKQKLTIDIAIDPE